MKHVKPYEVKLHEEYKNNYKTPLDEYLNAVIEGTKGTWKLNDGLVDVIGDIDIVALYYSPGYHDIKFGTVTGDFICKGIKLTSMKGFPKKVTGNFNCSGNQLTSLEGGPEEVGGSFDCSGNQLTNLMGGPEEVGMVYDCNNNKLTTLEGAPRESIGGFNCDNNELTTLEGGPIKVKIGYTCRNNKLTNLIGSPEEVDGFFRCTENPNLKTFEGMPKIIKNGFGIGIYFGTEEKSFGIKVWGKGVRENLTPIRAIKNKIKKTSPLLYTLIDTEAINKELLRSPGQIMMILKDLWGDENFKKIKEKIKIPKGYEEGFEIITDLAELGF